MKFNPNTYGRAVAEILAIDGNGFRLMPLAHGECVAAAREMLEGKKPADLFPAARAPEEALCGLWLYFSCLDECHRLAQQLPSKEGSYWHAIMHRQEPDPDNSAYWFRRVGHHDIFPTLAQEARRILEQHRGVGFSVGSDWDPFAFIDFCERARRKPGSEEELIARQIQLVEWQLLFDYCATPETPPDR